MKVVMYVHGGSKNHGCEAIVRSTAQLLKLDLNQSILLSYNCSEDLQYGLDSFVQLRQEINTINRKSLDFVKEFLINLFIWTLYFISNQLIKLIIWILVYL